MSQDAQQSSWSDSPPPPPPVRNDPVELAWSPTAAIQYGWRAMWGRPEIILVLFVAGLLGSSLSLAGSFVEAFHGPKILNVSLSLAGAFVQIYFSMTALRYCLKVARGEPTGINELFAGGPYLNVFLCGLLSGLLIIIGFLLLIVPGIILALGLGQATALVVDRGLGPIEAMRESWRITMGRKWDLLALGLLSCLVVLAGLLACLVGVVFAAVLLEMAHVYTYLRLSGQRCVRFDRS